MSDMDGEIAPDSSGVLKEHGLDIVRTVADLRARVTAWRHRDGARVGLVPTMGALHEGHLTLVRRALEDCDRVIVTLFVNPRQFGPTEDFARYPRDEAGDAAKLAAAGAHLLYAPDVEEMYGEGFATTVTVSGVTEDLEGAVRPHHFAGVATVVTKLLNQAQADDAYFGEKDYQQLVVVRRLAADLDIATRVHGVPTVRDSDGLALSSRNAYLGAAERRIAPALHRALVDLAAALARGEGPAETLIEAAKQAILAAGFTAVDYVELRDAETLASKVGAQQPARLLAAARLGTVRLIDNIPVSPR